VTAGAWALAAVPPVASGQWVKVRVTPSSDGDGAATRRAAVLAALFTHGSGGVHEDAEALVTFFPEPSLDAAALRGSIEAADADARIELSAAADENWGRRWREGVVAHVIGPLTVAPPWLADASDPARTVVIDPGMAFGTGEHESTRGVLRLLPHVVRAGDLVADLGAGSAVLSIAAAKLGAARVVAIEVDHDAIDNAERNVARNGVADRVHIIEGDAAALLPLVAPVRVVLANIISSVLVELLPVIGAVLTPDGQAVLSGILTNERRAMVDVYEAAGWRIEREDAEGDWWTAAIAAR
jgi:ribosomal protein L11 methyltransferase